MRRRVLACLVAAVCAASSRAEPAAARTLSTSIDLDYGYSQANVGGDVEAATTFNQKYEIKYETALTTIHDFLGAVRLELADEWYTDDASSSRVAPTLEFQVKGSQLAAKLALEAAIETLDAYQETPDTTTNSSSLTFDMLVTPAYWPEMKFAFQTRSDFQEYAVETTARSFDFSVTKDIYSLRLDYAFSRSESESTMPSRESSAGNKWAVKAAYKEILWFGTEFEIAYEINESYQDTATRGVFTGETQSYKQTLRTRFRNSLDITPLLRVGVAWEYSYDQDLLAREYDYELKNKYGIDMRWEPLPWLRINAEAKRDTGHRANVGNDEDERSVLDTLKGAFEMTSIPWMQLFGKFELKNDRQVEGESGGSVAKAEEEKYELIAKNRIGEGWDFTMNASTTNSYEDDVLLKRETIVKGDLKITYRDLTVTPSYQVSRVNEWEQLFDYPVSQQQVRSADIKFDYKMQLVDLLQVVFSHEYGVKVDDTLDAELDFERVYQISEGTRLSVVVDELFRDIVVEGNVERRATDTADDPDPELVELAYLLKLDWKFDQLTASTSFRYSDKGDTFDDISFNARASWKIGQLDMAGEYSFDKTLKDDTEPKDEKRKLSLRLRYKF